MYWKTLACHCFRRSSLHLLLNCMFFLCVYLSWLLGQAILRSPEPVSLGQWHRLVAERIKRAGHLEVDHGPVERRTSPGKAQGLNIHTPMYLGGVPNMQILPKPANVSKMFDGCIGEVRVLCKVKKRRNEMISGCGCLNLSEPIFFRLPSTTRRWICLTASQRANWSANVWTAAPVTAVPAWMVVTACPVLNMSSSASVRMDLKVCPRRKRRTKF